MLRSLIPFILVLTLLGLTYSCSQSKEYTYEVYQTSQAGDNLQQIQEKQSFTADEDIKKVRLHLKPSKQFQEIIGFGASFTESSAWNLATIPENLREEVLTRLFSPTSGAGFSLTRTHINSSDYSNKHYSYVEPGDTSLTTFSIKEDMKGFTGEENEQVRGIELTTPSYDLIPMIREAQNIPGADFKIIASPWSPPSWMKSGETAEMTNGSLLPQFYEVWAHYLSRYVAAYAEQGIDLWGITPQNEPLHAHDARWDSNGFTPEEGRDFLRDHLGPRLVADGHLDPGDLDSGLRVLIYDHNKSAVNDYVKATYNDPEAAKYAWGTAFHWYAPSQLEENNWYKLALDSLRTGWPGKGMIHTESSIDIDAEDPVRQYWRESTDYAGSFVPFDTYVYDIITDLNHGVQGYIEWCMILSNEGKPNPYDNFNSAPVLINPVTDEVIYTPLYYLLSHFSKFIRPGAHRIGMEGEEHEGLVYTAAMNPDGTVAVIVFNSSTAPLQLQLTLASATQTIQIAPRALQTIMIQKNAG
ncbi:glycoside hydrolase family 30 protein [Zeaxanthinibacter enoshimensis]|uniref:Glucosylceramidase n=1 Tax=Zeaxanthinibacter enoshimensis TaxID=392009 RepID=A0A4R6TPK6_9FLAO|nr:glycoside hydrolase family 30 protein [Zeaxanthinibacter enoshimensis]TDQ32197.1 glucosylceramidase [Zeaxanthinibacter enoshimensis]